jgi:hypothetical protein
MPQQRTPGEVITELVTGGWRAQALRTMAVLGLADHLAPGPRTVQDLAAQSATDPAALSRLLRALVALGLCSRDGQRFALTPVGDVLRTDSPDSVRPRALLLDAPYLRRAWEELPRAVRTGGSPFADVHGAGFWDYLSAHPQERAVFDAAMSSGPAVGARVVLDVAELDGVGTLVDVGGGDGRLLADVLQERRGLTGVLFDRPEGLGAAELVLAETGVADRCQVVGGDFFTAVPPGDVCLLAHVVHDWPDEEAVAILRSCRAALPPGGRVWLLERPVPDNDEGAGDALMDLTMLVLFGGRERTREDLERLLVAAGFGDVSVRPDPSGWAVVEGVVPGSADGRRVGGTPA